MTKQRVIHLSRMALPFLLAAVACVMVPFFDDPNPVAAAAAFVAWGCFIAAIAKVR